GTFYIDAGGRPPGDAGKRYDDDHLIRLAEMFRSKTDIPVKLDISQEVFASGTCPDAALYVGWYSLKQYVPAFKWNRGAVGFHIASWEAVNLRDPKSSEWVPRMLDRGNRVAATLGSVEEPFLSAFPFAEDFFPMLVSGKLTVCETYWRTVPNVSWRMMLIADPLYNPFRNSPHNMVLPEGMLPKAD
ncbi:MAG: TIGR03790 family protein, partial [Planctomycetes bacterium]|nr:TIGR03790 family protein [Planctomycetota bacterium]